MTNFARTQRLRRSQSLRDLLQEHEILPQDFIYPIFVEENLEAPKPSPSLPGVTIMSEKSLPGLVKEAYNLGIPAILLFGVTDKKDFTGSESMKDGGFLYRIIEITKQACPEITVIADTCFCEYTDHGHCGPLSKDGFIDNDKTIENLGIQAVNAAKAGADIIAPSGMMDGMVYAIRKALDENAYTHIPIMSYAAKFASGFYGPFRDTAGCALGEGKNHNIDILKDRKTYQMNPANALEAMREVEIDLKEGADMIIVKPGLPYLDIIYRVKERFQMPTFAYHVSGEYLMLKKACEDASMDYNALIYETFISFKRAGCNGIITYAALDYLKSQ